MGPRRCIRGGMGVVYLAWGARQHGAPARAVVFSPDGRWLASTGDDGTVKVWDLTGDRLLFTCTGHTAPVYLFTDTS